MDNYNYPVGSDTPNAPWNQNDNPEREIEVTVSITLSKTVKISVSNYTIIDSGKDEDGLYYEDVDYSDCNLTEAVKAQLFLPYEAGDLISDMDTNFAQIFPRIERIKEDLKGWNVDDLEVVID